MSSVPMPRDLSEEAVAMWLWDVSSIEGDLAWDDANSPSKEQAFAAARAVLALLREKVREAIEACAVDCGEWADVYGDRGDVVRCGVYRNASLSIRNEADEIVARVLGDHPSNASGGHDEGRPARDEAPRA